MSKDKIKIKNDRESTKRSLMNDSAHVIKRKQTGARGKRYKFLLMCVVCNGDAHGN
jgi:hypothetical protein